MQFDETPTMKELTTKYRKLSLEFHPDKNLNKVEAKEKFQELSRCFKLIGDFIVNNVSNATMDEEEEDFRKMFNMFNHDKRNTHCHTIFVENCNVNKWETVLKNHLGEPTIGDKHPGLIFKHVVNSKELTLTLYKTPKNDNRSKVHLQGNELEADNFVLETMPVLYAEVRRLCQMSLDIGGPGRNLRPRTVKEITKDLWCSFCDFRGKAFRDVQRHTRKEHSVKAFDRQRNLEGVDETNDEAMAIEEAIAVEETPTTEANMSEVTTTPTSKNS